MEVIAVENHPADSRVGLIEDGTVQTLTSRMGTGGVMSQWCSLFVATRFAEYKETLPTLRASGGDTGPGGEALIVYPNKQY